MNDEKSQEPLEFCLSDTDFEFPNFDKMWKDWIQFIPGIPQCWQARNRAEKLFRQVYKEWMNEVDSELKKAADIAYKAGLNTAEERIGESKYQSGYDYGYWKAQKEIKDKLLSSLDMSELPDEYPEDD